MIHYPAETGRLPRGNFCSKKFICIFTYYESDIPYRPGSAIFS